MQKLVRASCSVYRRLLVLYPREFRSRFGGELELLFEDCLLAAIERHGRLGAVKALCVATGELVTVATPLWLESPLVIAPALSFAISSVVFLALFRAIGQ